MGLISQMWVLWVLGIRTYTPNVFKYFSSYTSPIWPATIDITLRMFAIYDELGFMFFLLVMFDPFDFLPWWITTKSPFGKYPLSQWLTFKLFVDYILFSREIKGEQPLFCGPKSLEWESTFVSSPYHPCKVKVYFPTHFKKYAMSMYRCIYIYIYTMQLGRKVVWMKGDEMLISQAMNKLDPVIFPDE